MPSFLSKVFGRKKDEKEHSNGRNSESSLLEGKFEAVSPTVSPTAAKFAEFASNGHGREKEKEREFGLKPFRTKSNAASPSVERKPSNFPHLSLNLSSGLKDEANSRVLGPLFDADPDSQILLPDNVIGERRLTPLQTTNLVRACAQAITSRGLETLGIMHPHWHSASPDVQRRLISFFIHSLTPNGPITTLFPSSSSPQATFESEIQFARSPHDVAAVLRWGLRHLQLEGQAFGKNDAWYKDFLTAERAAEYPPDAFSTKLIPMLPSSHVETLKTTLEIMSSLAAHTEANSTSGSKLSKLFGLWLVSLPRVEPADDWASFYARWERAGRMLEHLFLAHIRNENRALRMPTRLTELVERYPYSKSTTDSDLLPRSRFSTRSLDSLYVRIETQTLNPAEAKTSFHPLLLIVEAFKAGTVTDGKAGESKALWEKVKKAALKEGNSSPQFDQIFSDETVRLLSMFPVDKDFAPLLESVLPARKRSISLGAVEPRSPAKDTANVHARASTDVPKPVTSPTSPSAPTPDWAEFSSAGFLESSDIGPLTLSFTDNKDVEITRPKKAAKKSKGSPGRGRRSLESRPPPNMADEFKPTSKSTAASIIQVDEAFIDFWSDALFDPISADWPPFVLCQLKPSNLVGDEKKVEWLVLEQAFVKPPAPPSPARPEAAEPSTSKPRASSPRPSFKSDLSGTFSATRKRFSIFTSSRSTSRQSMDSVTSPTKAKSGRGKKAAKSPQVGEMGEILAEEPEENEKVKEKIEEKKVAEAPKIRVPSPKPKKSLDASKKSLDGNKGAVPAASLAGAGAIAAAVVASTGEQEKVDAVTEPPATEAAPVAASEPVPVEEVKPVAAPEAISHEKVQLETEPVVEEKQPEPSQPEPSADLPEEEETLAPVQDETPVPASEPVVDTVVAIDSEPVAEKAPEPVEPEPTPVAEPAASEPVTEPEPTVPEAAAIQEPVAEPVVLEDPVAAEPVAVSQEAEQPTVVEPVTVDAPPVEPKVEDEPVKEEPVSIVGPEPASVPLEPRPEEQPVSVLAPSESEQDTVAASPVAPEEPVVPAQAETSAPTELPEVPTVETAPVVDDGTPSIEPVQTEAAEPVERSTHIQLPQEPVNEGSSTLPPAPESVVLAGETPGPEFALSSSEPAAIAQATEAADDEPSASAEKVVVDETEVKQAESHPNGNGAAPTPVPDEPAEDANAQDATDVVAKGDEPSSDGPQVVDGTSETAPASESKAEVTNSEHEGNGVVQEAS